jgi:tRNA A-37 threonylcarbamoyl transferase component Bud32
MLLCPTCGSTNPEGNDFCEQCAGRLTEPAPGIESYTLEGVLGRGASSVVYRASDVRTGRPVAVKALNPELLARPGLRERLGQEARVLQQLSHENIVKVVDYIESDEAVWLVTEAVEGASLRTVLIHAHQLEPEQALAIFAGMLAGVAHAHGRGLVHGDLKPENVLVEASGTAKLVDFGQAVRVGQATTGGTAAYMSPEAARGELMTPASDLYSIGAVLYEALTGRPPFLASTEAELLRLQLSEPPPPIPGVPAAIGALVDALLAKDASLRPRSAADVLTMFEAAVRDAYGSEWRRRAGVAALIETTATRFPTMSADHPGVGAASMGVGLRAAPVMDPPFTSAGVSKGVAVLRWLLALQLVWFLMFGVGGALAVWTLYQNGATAVKCGGISGFPGFSVTVECTHHHSFVLPIVLIVLGFVGFLATGLSASTWAVKRFGMGLVAYWRRRPGAATLGLPVTATPPPPAD